MRAPGIGPVVLVFAALLACKGESGESNRSSEKNSAPVAENTKTQSEEKLDKAAVCNLIGTKSESDRCSDCIDDADLSGTCSRRAEAFERCAGNLESIAGACAGECVNQCVRGQKACCECSADCIEKRRPGCADKYLALEKCTFEKCKKACS